ncbi:MAG: FAD-dependent oxidoreductase [Anaerolineae bacterium]
MSHVETDTITLTIDDCEVKAKPGMTVLEAADAADVYIPRLCSHPNLPTSKGLKPIVAVYRGDERVEGDEPDREFDGCQLCVVEIEGMEGYPTSCNTPVEPGMVVHTDTPELRKLRMDNLLPFLADHPHSCLTCAQREGCSRTQCSSNVPEIERCCPKLGNCEVQAVAEYVGIREDIPRYIHPGYPVLDEEPLFVRDYNLCIGCTRCVRACRELRGVDVLGFVFKDGKVVVGTVNPSLAESACRFCTACVEVCPTGALMDKRAIKVAEREAALVPCRSACPVGIDVPRYVHYIARGKFDEALAVIREKVPFPAVLGYICTRVCEAECRRGELNEPVAIRALKRFAAEHGNGSRPASPPLAGGAPARSAHNVSLSCASPPLAGGAPPSSPPMGGIEGGATGKKVAIVGAGPAGLTAGYYLARCGHAVTVFEARSEPGGTMRTAIPKKRLAREALEMDIKAIVEAGVDLRLNARQTSVDALFDERFDAVFLAVGTTYAGPPDFHSGAEGIRITTQGSIAADADTLATSREGVFAGGDTVVGGVSEDFIDYWAQHSGGNGRDFTDVLVDQIALHQGNSSHSVIRAIAAGRRAARSIDHYLGGEGTIDETLVPAEEPDPWLGREEGFAERSRLAESYWPAPPQLAGQPWNEPALDEAEAVAEARRCLRCNLRLELSSVILPPEKWLPFDADHIAEVPEIEGVFQLLDEEKEVIQITGTMNLRQELENQLATNENARFFVWEEDPMYTKRESELIQQYLQQYGQMPGAGSELDDLYDDMDDLF